MPQFEPASREYVKERAESNSHVHEVIELGDGLMLAYNRQADVRRAYTNLMEQTGWYVASYETFDSGDVAVLMPVTEVR